MALSCKLKLVRLSVKLKFQDRAECGKKQRVALSLPQLNIDNNFVCTMLAVSVNVDNKLT